MKRLPGVSLVAAFALAGCAMGSEGGPGATSSRQSIVGQSDETFRISEGKAILNQGDTKSVTILIKRALNFEEDVTLQFANLPKGLTVDNENPVIKHGELEARFALTASNDAALGDFSLAVTGHPTKGVDAVNYLKITVTKR